MATRRDVREAFYADIETAASAFTVDISQEFPGPEEDLPRIVHEHSTVRSQMNNGTAPVERLTDESGNVTHLVFSRNVDLTFTLTIIDDDAQQQEDLYEAVRSHFEQYTLPTTDEGSLQDDVHDVSVLATNSADATSREPVARADRLQVTLGYERFHEVPVDHIDTIEQTFDVDDIETITYTTN